MSVTVFTVIGILLWLFGVTAHVDVGHLLAGLVRTILNIWGAYAAIGAISLYVTMWLYWIGVERSSLLVRIGRVLMLLFGVHLGATVILPAQNVSLSKLF